MSAARNGSIVKGRIKNLRPHERLALDWVMSHEFEMPGEGWQMLSEDHDDAYFLIPELYRYKTINLEVSK